MAYADPQSYEEMISKLQTFLSAAEEQCTIMSNAGQDCVDNTGGDPAAQKSNTKLQECLGSIQQSLETINSIIAALQEELNDILEAAAKANFD